MGKWLIFIILIILYSWANDKYFIIDSSLYRINKEQRLKLVDNIIDVFYLNDKPYFIQQDGEGINILTIKNVKFIPFLKNQISVHKVLTIKDAGRYIGTSVRENKFFLFTEKLIYIVNSNHTIEKESVLSHLECVYNNSDTFVLKKVKSNAFLIYNINNLSEPVFTIFATNLNQIVKNNSYYLCLCFSYIYDNQYDLSIIYFNKQMNTTIFRKSVKIFYDSIFYILPINDRYVLLQEKEEATLYEFSDSFYLKPIKKVESLYSYFTKNYLFTINKNNLTIYYFQDYDFYPIFSVPNVSFIFYSKDKLYYLFYEKFSGIWKLNSLDFKNDLLLQGDEELIFYTLPEEVIPI
ncbi:MAG: hypothetical protein RMJ36_05895 [Candidatus Calescibacterium sp.]|nr:hypothetical protein [Candidatus Calescibacterium sp.]MDW8133168.1 hypothetical protein [Candidatus Calescibacterium sp.]